MGTQQSVVAFEGFLNIALTLVILAAGIVLGVLALITMRKLQWRFNEHPWIMVRLFQAIAGVALSLSYLLVFLVPIESVIGFHVTILRPSVAIILVSLLIPVIYSYRSRGY